MFFLYNLIYFFLFLIAYPVYSLIRIIKGKPPVNLLLRLGLKKIEFKKAAGRTVWIHAVSVGEVQAARPLINGLLKKRSDIAVTLSVTTETGKRIAENIFEKDVQIIPFPLDFTFSVRRYLDVVDPYAVIIMETELWPGFCYETKKRGVPLLLVNGRLSDGSYPYYRILKFFFRRVLACFSKIMVQTEEYRRRFIDIGSEPNKVEVMKSLKYDLSNFEIDADLKKRIKRELRISSKDRLFVAGSTHTGEEEILLYVYKKLLAKEPNLRLVLVPRRPQRFAEVEELIKKSGLTYCRRSGDGSSGDWKVLLVDKMGELKVYYSLAELVFVGGSIYPHGGQNLLEPAAFSVPVMFGPNVQNFQEMAEALIAEGGGFVVRDADECFRISAMFLEERQRYEKASEGAYRVIRNSQGGVEACLKAINNYLGSRKKV